MEMNFSPVNGGVPSEPLAFNEQLLPYIDLDFNEGGYTYGKDGFTTDANWQQFSRLLSRSGSAGNMPWNPHSAEALDGFSDFW